MAIDPKQSERESAPIPSNTTSLSGLAKATLLLLVFVSGASALLYQILWMRTLALSFGNAAQASAATLAAFFLGLALGSRVLGRAVSTRGAPLRAFAMLELGVVAGAIWFVFISALLGDITPAVEPEAGWVVNANRFALAVLAMLPATFCMGGTLPALGEAVAHRVSGLGKRVTLIYSVNTIGGTAGVWLGAFVLPPAIGYRATLVAALCASLGVVIAASMLSRYYAPGSSSPGRDTASRWRPERALVAAAVFSGAGTLALEVLWTRMFAQVFHNSVYSFGAVLVTFLFALGIGALLARMLASMRLHPNSVLRGLWLSSGLLVAATPFVFEYVTQGMSYVGRPLDFAGYVAEILATTTAVVLLPVIVMGAIFPYLLRVAESSAQRVGETVGDLAAFNIAGAAVGAVVAGFILLSWLGLWVSIGLIATLYVLATGLLVSRSEAKEGTSSTARALPATGIVLLVTALNPSQLDVVKVDWPRRAELAVEHWEGPHGVVAVVRRDRELALKINNFYTLGSTAAAEYEKRQAHLPLAIHGDARSVFFLGVGTGITAGAALAHPIKSMVAVELTGEVVTASKTHFAAYTNGLFSDGRARVLVEDGRSYLRQTKDQFDVVVSDLFVPWRAGVGALYTREHFSAVRDRLRADGIFCQWLPMFQLDEHGFKTIARTFADVFPHTTLWRGDFFGSGSIVALVGHKSAPRFSPQRLARSHQTLVKASDITPTAGALGSSAADFLIYYAGNVGASPGLLDGVTVDTDDRALMSFHAPIAQRQVAANRSRWFDGEALVQFLGEMLAATPPANDPVLAGLDETAHDRVRAGLALHRAQVNRRAGAGEEAARLIEEFRALIRPGSATSAGTEEARTALRREIQTLRADLEGRLQALEDRLPRLERPE